MLLRFASTAQTLLLSIQRPVISILPHLLQVLKHEPGAIVGLKVSRPDGSELDIELLLDAEKASEGDAFAVLLAMW